jgi:hypothetical protein
VCHVWGRLAAAHDCGTATTMYFLTGMSLCHSGMAACNAPALGNIRHKAHCSKQ